MNVEIIRLTPKLAQHFFNFFDSVAFSDNPDWADCYCCFYNFCDEEWNERTGAMNRSYAEQAIAHGEMNGYLAFIDGQPIGWINADKKGAYARLEPFKEPNDTKVFSIVCFTIAPGYRRQGFATKLLEAAVENAKTEGYEYIEAYPEKNASTDAHNYHGPVELYRKSGFEIALENENSWVVRKDL